MSLAAGVCAAWPMPARSDVTGALTYASVASTPMGLDYGRITDRPIRGARVQLVDATSGATLAEAASGDDGRYHLAYAGSSSAKLRVLAETVGPLIRILDNTDNGALYAMESDAFGTGGGAALNLHAPSGWGGSGYTGGRVAAPFAILDAAYSAARAFLAVRGAAFPELRINWSSDNRPEPGQKASGQIGTSHWDGREIYLLGKENVDTDEFDGDVIVHEWGHYFETLLGRSESPGGPHGGPEPLDARVAFSEGWGNALSAIVGHPDTVYTDALGPGQADGFGYDLEDNSLDRRPGWFSEDSVQFVLYDLADAENEGSWDRVALGLGPIYDVLTGPHRATPALSSLFTFLDGLNRTAPQSADGVEQLGLQHRVARVLDAFGTGETNDGGSPHNLPVYRQASVGATLGLTLAGAAESNRVGQNRYATFVGNGGSLSVTAASDRDVGLQVWESGRLVGESDRGLTGAETAVFTSTRDALYVAVVTGFADLPEYAATLEIAAR